MKIKVIGTGAAGNKAAIMLLEKDILDESQVKLVNSTARDIPEKYRSNAIIFEETDGGCGKETSLGKELAIEALQTDDRFDSFIDQDDEALIIVTSTEGGTGCGSSVILADYYSSTTGIQIQIFAFTGFEEDGRGLQNTIEFFQAMKEEYTVNIISNIKFLESNPNKLRAQIAANEDFCERIKVLIADGIIDSEQNIDKTDLYKVVNTPGYSTILKTNLGKIKNVDNFNKICSDMIDNDKSLETTEKSAKRIAVFINATEDTLNNMDLTFSIIKNKMGVPYELFNHIQCDEQSPESIAIIVSGMKLPLDVLEEIYDKYKEESKKVNKNKDSFFDRASELKGNSEDDMFNSGISRRRQTNKAVNKQTFFDKLKQDSEKEKQIKEDTIIDKF